MRWDKSPIGRKVAYLGMALVMASLAACSEYSSFSWGDGLSWQQARLRSLSDQSKATNRQSNEASRHVVMPGDTVSELAQAYRVSTRSLVETNSLGAPYRIYVGQVLDIPARGQTGLATARKSNVHNVSVRPAERIHIVARGETISAIAHKHGYRTGDVLALNRNVDPRRLIVGTKLQLPPVTSPNARTVVASNTSPAAGSGRSSLPRPVQNSKTAEISVAALPSPVPRKKAPPAVRTEPPALTGTGFMWPVRGEIISSFGPQPSGLQNDGINVRAAGGTTVVAAENGVVVYAGSDIDAFGRMLMIRHADGYLSAYAHNSTLLVAEGDKVKRGQPVAKVGMTGDVLEPQLHFELRKGRDAVDPTRYLKGENVQLAQSG